MHATSAGSLDGFSSLRPPSGGWVNAAAQLLRQRCGFLLLFFLHVCLFLLLPLPQPHDERRRCCTAGYVAILDVLLAAGATATVNTAGAFVTMHGCTSPCSPCGWRDGTERRKIIAQAAKEGRGEEKQASSSSSSNSNSSSSRRKSCKRRKSCS